MLVSVLVTFMANEGKSVSYLLWNVTSETVLGRPNFLRALRVNPTLPELLSQSSGLRQSEVPLQFPVASSNATTGGNGQVSVTVSLVCDNKGDS